MAAKFIRKFDEAKITRAIRLTDTAWQGLQNLATLQGKSRADLIEHWARQPPYPDRALLQSLANEILLQTEGAHQELIQRTLENFIDRMFTHP